MPWYGAGCSALLRWFSAGWGRRCLQPRGRAALLCAPCSRDSGKVAWQNRGTSSSLRELMFLVIHRPSKAPSDPGAHSQRLTQPSPLISSFLPESSPWKDAALQEDIPGSLITALAPALLCLWSKHLLFHLISNKWEAWVGGAAPRWSICCHVMYFILGPEWRPWGTFSRGLHKPPLFTGWLFEEGGECELNWCR